MAYESRIMIVNALREKNPKSENFGKVLYADIVADIYLGCMGYNNGCKNFLLKKLILSFLPKMTKRQPKRTSMVKS